MDRISRSLVPCALAASLLATPAAAEANVGTPLMWATALHLGLLNAVIGVVEAGLLRRFFGAAGPQAVGWMVAANYVSAGVGFGLLPWAGRALMEALPGGAPLYKAQAVLVAMAVLALALSVLVEWPFVAGAFRPLRPGARRTLLASSAAQAVSYTLLLGPLYWAASPTTLYREANVVRDVSFASRPVATVYYLAPGGGSVWRVRADGTGRACLRTGLPRGDNLRLSALEDTEPGTFCLWVGALEPRRGQPPGRVALENVGPVTPAIEEAQATAFKWDGNWFAFGWVVDLRPEDQRSLKVHTGFWPAEGLEVLEGDEVRYALAFETPFARSWLWRNATVLSGDQVVAQLGWGDQSQVVLLDLRSRKLAVIAMGQSPVVVPADGAR